MQVLVQLELYKIKVLIIKTVNIQYSAYRLHGWQTWITAWRYVLQQGWQTWVTAWRYVLQQFQTQLIMHQDIKLYNVYIPYYANTPIFQGSMTTEDRKLYIIMADISRLCNVLVSF